MDKKFQDLSENGPISDRYHNPATKIVQCSTRGKNELFQASAENTSPESEIALLPVSSYFFQRVHERAFLYA